MKKTKILFNRVKIKDKTFPYVLKRRRGSRSVKLSVYADGRFVVTAPRWYPIYIIQKFIEEKSEWIFEKLKNFDFEIIARQSADKKDDYQKLKETARTLVKCKLEFFNRHYNFRYNRVAIRSQRSCWGSCSQKKNLNFNYRIIHLEEELQNYLIVHELCHLQELNHGDDFWQLVSQTTPNYKKLKKQLRTVKFL